MKNIKEYWLEILLAILSLLIVTGLLWTFHSDYHFLGCGKLNIEATNSFGTYLAGTVGPLIALLSVVLFYKALKLQRTELKHLLLTNEIQKKENEKAKLYERINRNIDQYNNELQKLEVDGSKGLYVLDQIIDHLKTAELNFDLNTMPNFEVFYENELPKYFENRHLIKCFSILLSTYSLLASYTNRSEIADINQSEKEEINRLIFYTKESFDNTEWENLWENIFNIGAKIQERFNIMKLKNLTKLKYDFVRFSQIVKKWKELNT